MAIIQQTLKQLSLDLAEVRLSGPSVGEYMSACHTLAKEAILALTSHKIKQIDATIAALGFERGNWISVKKDVPRTVETIFGPLTYQRRYYRDRQTNEYCYLTDVLIGIRPYQRVEDQLALTLVESASEMSYRRASKAICEGRVSATTVMNSIR